ncbi:MAG: hypothetical protein M3256_16340 [Actinomycetota bacterium]|nr:hypothetical protein [Actinomycetota bacterium]
MAEATVLIAGDQFRLRADRPFQFGRADADGVVGLDAEDMGISAVAGSVESAWGLWWVVNRSRKRQLLLDRGAGVVLDCLASGQRFAINVVRFDVLVPGAIYTHRLEVVVPADELAPFEARRPQVGTTRRFHLSEPDRDALVAVLSDYLQSFPHRTTPARTYRQAAELLGLPWTMATVRKQIEQLKERVTRSGISLDGAEATFDLADHLICTGLLEPDDLNRVRVGS